MLIKATYSTSYNIIIYCFFEINYETLILLSEGIAMQIKVSQIGMKVYWQIEYIFLLAEMIYQPYLD